MTEHDGLDISRRQALAALGSIGVASTGAGLGTSAFFSDRETFTNNTLTAGSLDLKVGWEEHYSDWSPDEDDGLEGEVSMGDTGSVGLPTQNSSLISVENVTEARRFLNNTEIDQYPDGEVSFDDAVDTNGCEVLPDGSDQSPVLIDLEDVKPGDFGEVTFAFALCTNPGYLWLNGALRDANENGYTEPERDDEDEDGPGDEDTVELLDEVRTAFWYDDGDNLQSGGGGGGGGQADIVFVIDASGSITGDERPAIEQEIATVAQSLQDQGIDAQFAVVDYIRGAGLDLDLTADVSTIEAAFQDGTAGTGNSPSDSGGESLSNALLYAADTVSFRDGSKRIYVGVTDELDQSTQAEKDDAVAELNGTDSAFLGLAQTMGQVSDLLGGVNQSQFESVTSPDDIGPALQGLVEFTGGVVDQEEVFFEGTLRETLTALSSGGGIPLDGNPGTAYDEVPGTGDDPNRDAYVGDGTVHYVGFAWYLPVDHANEIQTDSARFDLGFYAEQERHNDGAGQFANR